MAIKCETLLTTPAENAYCPDCKEHSGTRHPGTTATFPHCKLCGSTSLLDDRSPWEILFEAKALAARPGLDVEIRWGRQDAVERIARQAAEADAADPDHECMDCRKFRPLAGV